MGIEVTLRHRCKNILSKLFQGWSGVVSEWYISQVGFFAMGGQNIKSSFDCCWYSVNLSYRREEERGMEEKWEVNFLIGHLG